MRHLLTIAALVVSLGAAAAPPALSQHAAGPEAAAPIDAQIGFDAVAPQHLEVLQGDTVHWTNVSVRVHTVTADDGSFDTGTLDSGAAGTFTAPSTPGTYTFACAIHPSMTGALVVQG
jgi:plastocyanin